MFDLIFKSITSPLSNLPKISNIFPNKKNSTLIKDEELAKQIQEGEKKKAELEKYYFIQ